MLSLGAVQSVVDPCLFVIWRSNKFIKFLWHVDDAAVFSNSQSLYDDVFKSVQEVFDISKDPLEHFLGIVINHRDDGAFELSQAPYLDTLLERIGLASTGTANSPEASGRKGKLTRAMSPQTPADQAIMDAIPYREVVGALLWLTRATRPEIAHSVGQVSKFLHNPGWGHWCAVKRICLYLKRVRGVPFVIKGDGTLIIEAYSDSDWAGCPDTAISTTGFLVYVGSALVAWRSKEQKTWAQSATEAEYVAALAASNEVVWLRNILGEMWLEGGEESIEPVIIWVDNEGAVQQSDHACAFNASKHYTLAMMVLRQRCQNGVCVLRSILTNFNLSDILTKALQPTHFKQMASDALQVSFY
jgi:hypothetical protein